MTLGDAYSSPLVVEALTRSRDATVEPGDDQPNHAGKPRSRKSEIARWDPWVRTFLGVQGLLEGLSYDVQGTYGKPGHRVTLSAGAGRLLPLVSLARPGHAGFEAQIRQVLDWAELRSERSAEILAQIDNQYAFWGSIFPFHSGRMRKTVDLIEVVIQFSVFVESRFKHEFGVWRPAELSPQVQPMITTPGHGSFPSGHCTQSYAVAHVLAELLGQSLGGHQARAVQLRRLAARVSMNRVVAGVHFPVDNLVGRLLGTALADYALARMGARPQWLARSFEGTAPGVLGEFLPECQPLDGPKAPAFYRLLQAAPVMAPPVPDVLAQLWAGANAECAYLR